MVLMWLLLFSFLGSVGSVTVAAAFLLLPEQTRAKLIPWLLSYATGTLLATALLAILPEALEHASAGATLQMILAGIVFFFLLEKFVLWHHCHHRECEIDHPNISAGSLIIVGDGLHNFVDGVLLAATFLTSVPLGIATGLAVIAHEIPQEVGDFALLLHSGYSRRKALLVNIGSGLTTIVGALLGYAALPIVTGALSPTLALAAASFLYIAMVDVIPELHNRVSIRDGLYQSVVLLGGIGTVALLTFLHH